jgi:membrane dipeptidase
VLRRPALFLLAICVFAGCRAESPDERIRRLHRSALVVDGHADTTLRLLDPAFDFAARHDAADGMLDLPRAREGGLDAQFFSIYVGKLDGDGRAVRAALERIDAVYELARRHPDEIEVVTDAAGIRRAAGQGKLAALLGVEGGHMIEGQLGVLRDFQRLGVRYLTLTHSFHLDWADSAGTGEPLAAGPSHGLSKFGEDVVRELNRLGVMVDVSHVSDETFWDALRVSEAPPIASHSSCRAVYDHPRNLSDDMLRALAAKGGVVMINYFPGYTDADTAPAIKAWFTKQGPELAKLREAHKDDAKALGAAFRALVAKDPLPKGSLARLLDHFDHALRVAGPGHVGLGSDFDGVVSMPAELDEASDLENLTRGLVERGWSDDVVRGVLGENLLRVLRETELVAARLNRRSDGRSAAPPSR